MEQFLHNQDGQLQAQILQLPSNKVQNDNLRQEKLDTYLGIARGLSDPFNLFVNVTDIQENRNLIYFFSYSMGVKKVVVWGTYDKSKDKIEVESGCRFTSWKYITYINMWKDMNYQIHTVLMKNRIGERINKYMGNTGDPLKINNETDLKAWKYMLAYFDDNITEDDLIFLFDRLDISKLSYNYENYNMGKSPILDFFDLFNLDDLVDDEQITNVREDIEDEIKLYEKNKLNMIHDTSPDSIKGIIMRIVDLFINYISKSDYVGNESVKLLPVCPQTIFDCDPDQLEDENNECSVFTFGKYSFSRKDDRYGSIQYEDDLT
jgi:hypothetical protein